jgi:hypothetical protein
VLYGRLHLRVPGVTNSNLRQPRFARKTTIAPLVVLASVSVVVILERTSGEADASSAIEEIAQEHAFSRGHTLFLEDISGSMNSYDATTRRRLAALGSAGMLSGDHRDIGETGNEFPDFLEQVGQYAPRKDIDTLYVFADLNWDWDGSGRGKNYCVNSDAGVKLTVDLLRSTKWRIYFETVNCDPPPALAQLAEESGGGIIRTSGKE